MSMKCRICGNENMTILTNKLRCGNGTVFYCEQCDYGMLAPAFQDAVEYYNVEYREKFKDILTEGKESPEEIFTMRKDYQRDRFRILMPFFDIKKSFLEIGSSAGQFLYHIAGKFKTITGIELDRNSADFCRTMLSRRGGGEIYTEPLENVMWKQERTFDYIAFFQVLEHIEEPLTFLMNVRESLNDNGRIFVEVPNLNDPLRSLWDVEAYEQFYYHEAHLSYFSEVSLRKMLGCCGFEVENLYFIQDYNILNHLYWYFNNRPQTTCEFGLSEPHITFKNAEAGEAVNYLFSRMNEEYFRILADYKLTSNLFAVARKAE